MKGIKITDNNLKGILFAGTTTLLWGFLSIFLKIALKEVDSITIIWFRFFSAFVILSSYFLVVNRSHFKIFKKPPIPIIFASICLGLNYIGYIKGVELAGPATAQVLIQTAQILLVIAGVFIFKEKLSKIQIFGFTIAAIGFSLFYSENLSNINMNKDSYDLGVFWVLFGAVIWVVYAIIQKNYVQTYSPQSLNLIIYLMPIFMFLHLVNFEILFSLSFSMWMLMLFLGLNTLIAYGALAEAFKYIEATKIGIIITLNPIITLTALSFLEYFEIDIIENIPISTFAFVGGALVVAGAILAISKRKNKIQKI